MAAGTYTATWAPKLFYLYEVSLKPEVIYMLFIIFNLGFRPEWNFLLISPNLWKNICFLNFVETHCSLRKTHFFPSSSWIFDSIGSPSQIWWYIPYVLCVLGIYWICMHNEVYLSSAGICEVLLACSSRFNKYHWISTFSK